MKHRRHKAMRFEKLLWITKGAANRVGFLSNKYTPPRSRGFDACISSRITTVIHVARYHQINYNWFNEPFAVSQYNLFILRHAWLNLWDKHMTTGRINQVTVQRPRARARKWLGELLGPIAGPGRSPGVCHRSFQLTVAPKSRPSSPAAPAPQGPFDPGHAHRKFLVPRSRTPQELSPGHTGPRSAPSEGTTRERQAHCGTSPERGGSPTS